MGRGLAVENWDEWSGAPEGLVEAVGAMGVCWAFAQAAMGYSELQT